MKLDTRRQVETPEGLALGLPLAGVLPRASALLVDLILRIFFYIATYAVLAWFGEVGEAFFGLFVFMAEWFYFVIFEMTCGGVTPGKRWVGLRVLHDDGTPVGWNASLVRNLMRAVDFLPLCYGFGILSASLSPSFRRLGDWAAGTVVIHDASLKRRKLRHLGSLRNRALSQSKIHSVPPPLVLDREEQGALLAFSQRRSQWSQARAEELAGILEPVTGMSGEEGLQRTLGYGAWLEDEA